MKIIQYNVIEAPDEYSEEFYNDFVSIFGQGIETFDRLMIKSGDNYETLFLVGDSEDHTKFKKFLDSYGIFLDSYDLTNTIESGRIDQVDDSDEFISIVEKFFEANPNLNWILNKISKNGVDSLSMNEKKFLNTI
jgi:hypothetical protein